MAVLVLLIGVPGSGKSTVATRFHSLGYPVISTDQIRAQLFGDPAVQGAWPLIWQQVEQQFQQAAQSELALYDATNARRRGRREVIRLARQTGFGRVCGLWLNPPLDLCLERNCQRSRQVPEAVIRRMYQQIRTSPPKLSEGLDLLIHCGDSMPDVTDWLGRIQAAQAASASQCCVTGNPRNSVSSTGIAPPDRSEPNLEFGNSW